MIETERQKLRLYRTEQLAQAKVIADLKDRIEKLERHVGRLLAMTPGCRILNSTEAE